MSKFAEYWFSRSRDYSICSIISSDRRHTCRVTRWGQRNRWNLWRCILNWLHSWASSRIITIEGASWATELPNWGCHYKRARAGSVCAQRAERPVDEPLGSVIQRSETPRISARALPKGTQTHTGISGVTRFIILGARGGKIKILKFQLKICVVRVRSPPKLEQFLKIQIISGTQKFTTFMRF